MSGPSYVTRAAAEADDFPGGCYRLEPVRCGKPTCTRCPHGPYWYRYYRRPGGRVVSKYVGRQLPGPVAARRELRDVAAGAGAAEEVLRGGLSATVHLVTMPDGRRAVRKTPRPGLDGPDDVRFAMDGEELAPLVGEAIGAPVAATWRDGPAAVWVEHVDGRPARPGELAGTPEAIRIGLLDAVTGNHDRLGGLIVTPAGQLAGYDHGGTWLQCELGEHDPYLREPGAPMALFVTADGRWRDDPPLPRAEAAAIRQRVAALAPAFVRRGRGAWLDFTLAALDEITRRAPE